MAVSKRSKFNGNRAEVKALRQLAVAGELARGKSEREIRTALEGQGNVNPNTGRAWSLGIIHRDCEELLAGWKAAAAADIAEVKGRQWAEIQEAKRMAWRLADVNQVRQLIKLEMELIGTEAPKRQEVRAVVSPGGEFEGISDDDLRSELRALARRYTAGGGDVAGLGADEGIEADADSAGEGEGGVDA